MITSIDNYFHNCNYDVVKVFAWVNSDLDGVGSAILLGNLFKNFEYRHCFYKNFSEQYKTWSKEFADEYEKIFIVGMVLDQKAIKDIDSHRIVFVNDEDFKLRVMDSSVLAEECTSCTKLLYKKFKDKIDFPKNLKKLFLYVDDYNSYALKHEETKYINAFYRKSGGNRFVNLVKRFWNGFDGFTKTEINLAESFFEEIQSELQNLTLYSGEWEGYKVISTISKCSANELAHSIIDNYDTDVVIILNPDTHFVSFRKNKDSTVDLNKIAKELCDGGGKEYAAGGSLTKTFLEFTQKLKEL